MKFGSQFQEALQRDEYPQEWIESAISYKKLKKCIKRVQQELLSLGLDQETLEALWQHVESSTNATSNTSAREEWVHYGFSNDERSTFIPKLTIAINPADGSPMDAWLSPETRRYLREVGRRNSAAAADLSSDNALATTTQISTQGQHSDSPSEGASVDEDGQFETIEIPLTSDSEFFQILRKELTNLEHIQEHERDDIQNEIVKLGGDLRNLKESKKKRSKQEIEAWREIFRLYDEAQVFVSTHEIDHGVRNASQAQAKFKYFTKALAIQQAKSVRLGQEATVALDRFLNINVHLLRLMRFQEINRLALTKIMKKFDKRTALRAQSNILQSLTKEPFMTQDLAKATCFTISDEILNIIPQLDDYLCPVCFSISYKPVRLRCNHVFCIRCIIVLQRAEQDHCPLCRENGVIEATEDHLDRNLQKFLENNFKSDVKEKQRANQIAAGIDQWGETYQHSGRCQVM